MKDVIDRQDAIDVLNAKANDDFIIDRWLIPECIRQIERLPTIGPESVVHAHWIEKEDCTAITDIPWSMCSACGSYSLKLPYCAFCGANMDEVIE